MQLVLAVTDRCNYSCSFCYVNPHPPKRVWVDEERLYSRLAPIAELGLSGISLSGGEPTLASNLRHVLIGLHDHCSNIAILSNGSNLRAIRENDDAHWQLSLDAPGSAHDELRGRTGAFARVIEAISICERRSTPASLQSTISTLNIDTLPQLLEFSRTLPVQSLRIQFVSRGRLALQPHQLESALALLTDLAFVVPGEPRICTNLVRSHYLPEIFYAALPEDFPWFSDIDLREFRFATPDSPRYLPFEEFLNPSTRKRFAQKALDLASSSSISLQQPTTTIDRHFYPERR